MTPVPHLSTRATEPRRAGPDPEPAAATAAATRHRSEPSPRLIAGVLAAVAAIHAALLLERTPDTAPRYALNTVRPIQASLIGREPPARPADAGRPASRSLRHDPAAVAAAPPAAAPLADAAGEPVDAGAPAAVLAPRYDADYLDNPPPHYPPLSRRLGEQGEARVRVLVDAAGRPVRVELAHSSRYPRLDAAAIEAVRQWRFVPARRGAQAVEAWVLVPVAFSLRR